MLSCGFVQVGIAIVVDSFRSLFLTTRPLLSYDLRRKISEYYTQRAQRIKD